MKSKTLRDLFLDELKDLYDVENRLVKALPKMAKATNSEELGAGFEEHLKQTREHANRLKEVFTSLGEKAVAKKCPSIIGLLEEVGEMIHGNFEGPVRDAALISTAQRVEHYEIAAYGCVHSWAGLLGEEDASALLAQTLEEEKETNEKLTELAGQINTQALGEDTDSTKLRNGQSNLKARSAKA
jgi:ferritin-like metal-binding protein YciE